MSLKFEKSRLKQISYIHRTLTEAREFPLSPDCAYDSTDTTEKKWYLGCLCNNNDKIH